MISIPLLAGVTAGNAESESEASEIVELETRWSDSFGAGDLEAIVALMARDSVLIMPGSPPVVGIDAIREATRAMLESDDVVSWRSDFTRIAPGGEMAYDYGTATTRKADGTLVSGHYLVVWVKEDGKWKVAADMFN